MTAIPLAMAGLPGAGPRPAVRFVPGEARYHRPPAGARVLVWAVVLVVHVLGLVAWFQQRQRVPAPAPKVVTLQLLPLQPVEPLPPEPVPVVRPQPVAQPQRVAPLPRRVAERPAAVRETPAPQPRVIAAPAHPRDESDEWVQPAEDPAAAAAVGVRRAPAAYAESVKSRVVAQVVYPAGAVYPAPRGYKGDPLQLRRQCTIPYEVVVNRQGAIVSYEIDACHDDLLDAAAEAAILKAQPFPPPPDGAEQYRIFGSINFMRPRLPTPSR